MKIADAINLMESRSQVLWRGVKGSFNSQFHNKQDIIWVSTSKPHAELYAEGGEVLSFKLTGATKMVDLGYRTSSTDTTAKELCGRIITRLHDANISRKTYEDVSDAIDEFIAKNSGYKRVWEWVDMPQIRKIFKMAGWNVIVQREGSYAGGGDIETYGALDKKLLRRFV